MNQFCKKSNKHNDFLLFIFCIHHQISIFIFIFVLFLFLVLNYTMSFELCAGIHSQNMDGEDYSSSSFSSASRASLDQPDCLHHSSRSPSNSGSGENLIVLCNGDSSSSDSPSSYQNAE